MFRYIVIQMKRKPLPPLAVLLFAAVLAAVLCGLQAAAQKEADNYAEMYRNIPVSVVVTDLTGTRQDNLDADKWVYNILTSSFEMGEYLTDFRVKMTTDIDVALINDQFTGCNKLIGLTSIASDITLAQSGESAIQWRAGYDASIFSGDDLVCIIPESIASEIEGEIDKAELSFSSVAYTGGQVSETWNYDCSLKVVGTHALKGNLIYCPFSVVKTVYGRLEDRWTIDAIGATVIDNYKIAEMWETADGWFVKPDPLGVKIPWNYSWYSYYPYALKVNDSQLIAAAETLESSMKLNEICTFIVFCISAASSFFVGFLMIRSRKREIALMRTMGTPNMGIYSGFVLEQMVCVILGAALGGFYYLWQPAERLLAFVGIYFVGLSIALLIFLHTNLISTIKEDE